MLSKNIDFKNFNSKKKDKKVSKLFNNLIKENNEIIKSMKQNYKDSFNQKHLVKSKKNQSFTLIGMGGSILGSKAIYSFLKEKIKKNFIFIDNLIFKNMNFKKKNKKNLNLIISKSGNTLETIANLNVLSKNKQKNIFITERKDSYLKILANKLQSEIIEHNNFIGGRYSVLSEVGMLPASLMGLNVKKFRKFNDLIKNKNFINSLIFNVSSTLELVNKKKFNSIILNYDERSSDLFEWYQQLIAESLGKKGKGILPVISNMPKDNHSLMQLYLDGFKNNFYTFYFVNENLSKKIDKKRLLNTHFYLKNKNLSDIKRSQFQATEKVFKSKNIPFRSFLIKKRSEETLGELFVFFMLETILLGKALKLNPYDQPAVELIKYETKKLLVKI